MLFVLVHSPLVDASTWLPVAGELEARGRHAIVPRLGGPGGAPPQHWRDCVGAVSEAVRMVSDPIVLAGHSGGGLLLPAIAEAVAPPVFGLIFVDSGIPAASGETPLAPPRLVEHLRTRAVDGRLPPWSTWWGEAVMHELVPDDALRTALERDMPSLPLGFFEEGVPSPVGWEHVPCGYLLLSDAYAGAAEEARTRGWPVEACNGSHHLHTVVAPDAVAHALLRLALA